MQFPTINKLRQYASLLLLLSSVVLVVVTTTYVIKIGHKASTTMDDVGVIASNANLFLAKQKQVIESPDYQLAIKRNLQFGEAMIATTRLVNTQTIPRIHRAIESFDVVGQELAKATQATSRSVNLSLIPEIKRTIQDTDEAIKDAGDNLDDAFRKLTPEARVTLESAAKTINSLDTRINDPGITATLNELSATATQIRQSSENLQFATVSIKDTLSYAPEVGKNVAKFSRSQNKITWAVTGVRLLKIWF